MKLHFLLNLPKGAPSTSVKMGPNGPITMDNVVTYHDVLTNTTRTLRRAGKCYGCSRTLWHADDSQGAEVWATSNSLEASDYGMVGPTIGLCLECANGRTQYGAALDSARRHYWLDA